MGNAIGIDLNSRGVHLVQVSRRRGRLELRGTYTTDVGGGELSDDRAGAAALLADAIRRADLKTNAPVVIGLPQDKVFFGSLRTDVTRPEDVRRLLKFELEDDVPVPFDDLVADICGHRQVGEGWHEYLIGAVSREEIDNSVRVLAGAGCRCSVCSTDVCALATVARLVRPAESEGPAVAVHVDGHRMVMALLYGGAVACARHVACPGNAETICGTLAREIELTVRKTLGRRQNALAILLSGPDALVRELAGKLSQATGCAVQPLCPLPLPSSSMASDLDGQFAIALGLALIGLDAADNELNFLKADLSQVDRAARFRVKRAVLVGAVLLVAILGLLGLRTFREFTSLEAERARTVREIRAAFVELFPEEKKIVNEAAQMKEHLNSLQKEHDVLAAIVGKQIQPLRVLQLLSERMTAGKEIGISSFSVKDKAVRIAGTGRSFESIEQFVEELRKVPEFLSIELEDMAQSRGSDRPEFRLLISVKTG
jgi:Tfp pilus assembly PilM family ATPase/Tfp pilus assembly protein PilN